MDLIREAVGQLREKLHASFEKIIAIEPHRLLGKKKVDLNNLRNRTAAAMRAALNNARLGLTAQENRLAGLDPKAVLQRGYSITTNKRTGLLVRRRGDVRIKRHLSRRSGPTNH